MTTDQSITIETAAALFRSLIELLIDYPQNLVITPHVLKDSAGKPWRVDWEVRPDVNDAGKVIGKAGAHVKALKRIVSMVGDMDRLNYVLRVADGTGERRPEIQRRPARLDYTCHAHLEVLNGVLLAVGISAVLKVDDSPGSVRGYIFKVEALNRSDDDLLTEQPENRMEPSLLDALAVLFKAAGHRDGVVYRVEGK